MKALPYIFLFVLHFYTGYSQCSTSNSGAAANTNNNNSVGTFSWSNTSNVQSSDNSYASAGLLLSAFSTANSNYLVITDFGFSIPSGVTICGIEAEIESSALGLGIGASVRDNSVKIIKGGIITGEERAGSGNWLVMDAYKTYGNNIDTWGTTWTAEDINDAGFGIAISARLSTGVAGLFLTPQIDDVIIKVHYNNIVVPVKLKAFSAKRVSNKVQLDWTTSMESNNKEFILERSTNNFSWTAIDTIPGAVNSYYDKYYTAYDNAPQSINYYRLKQIDIDGRSEISKTISVKMPELGSFTFHVEPSLITFNAHRPIKEIAFYKLGGTEILPISLLNNAYQKKYSTENLSSGIYFARILLADEVITRKFIISR